MKGSTAKEMMDQGSSLLTFNLSREFNKMKRNFLITITIVFVFLITGCVTNTGTSILYEDETVLRMSDGRLKVKVDEPLVEGTDENGVSYLRIKGSKDSWTCECKVGRGNCSWENIGGNWKVCRADNQCTGCGGNRIPTISVPDSVKWAPH